MGSKVISPTLGQGDEVKSDEIEALKKCDQYLGKHKVPQIAIMTPEYLLFWSYSREEDRDKDYTKLKNA